MAGKPPNNELQGLPITRNGAGGRSRIEMIGLRVVL